MLVRSDTRPGRRGRGWLAVGGICAVGLSLRLAGIGFGLPGLFVFDEPLSVNHAVRFGGGSLHPPDLLYPTAYKYLLTVLYGVFFAVGRVAGWFADVAVFKRHWFSDPTDFFVIARSVSAVCGAGCCALVIWLGRQLGMSRVWSAAAGAPLAAGAGVHHLYSQIAKPDMAAAFLMLATLCVCCQVMQTDLRRRWIWVGALAGLSAGTKYNGLLLLGILAVVLLVEMFFRPAAEGKGVRRRLVWAAQRCLIIGTGAAVAFLVVCPYAVLDAEMFVRDWRFLQQNHSLTSDVGTIPVGLWRYFRLFMTDGQEGVGAVMTVLGGVGFLVLLASCFRRTAEAQAGRVVVAFCVVYISFFASRTGTSPVGQYLLPVTSVWVLLGVYGIGWLHGLLSKHRPAPAHALAVMLLLAAAARPARQALLLDLDTYIEDPRVAAARWCEESLPAGTKIFVEGDSVRYPRPTKESFQREREYMAGRFESLGLGRPAYRPERLEAVAAAPEPKFDLGYYWLPPRFLSEMRAEKIQSFSPFMLPIDKLRTDLKYWVDRGYRYFLLRSDHIAGRLDAEGAESYPRLAAFYRDLVGRGRVAARFEPAYRVRRAPSITIYRLPDELE